MEPIRLIIVAFKIFLVVGLTCGYAQMVRDMAQAAVGAHAHDTLSASKFNKMLWEHSEREMNANAKRGKR